MNTVLGKLQIVVNDGRWDAYGDPADPMTNYAMGVLSGMGGVNASVEPGIWEFTVIQSDNGQLITTMFPVS